MHARHEDLNQSSRLDLDFDDWGGDLNESNASPHLEQIAESRSASSKSSCSSVVSASSMESTVPDEDAGNNASSGRERLRRTSSPIGGPDGGRRRHPQDERHYTKNETNGASRPGGRQPQDEKYHSHNETNGTGRNTAEQPQNEKHSSSRYETNGVSRTRGRQPQHYSHHETNGVDESNGVSRNAGRNIQRAGTHSTLDTSASSQRSRIDGQSDHPKLVKIKLWDPGDSSAEPSVVSVALEMKTKQELGSLHDFRLRVGQKIELYHPREQRREKTVLVTWELPPTPKEESWQPPFRISEEEELMPMNQRSDDQRSRPQPPREEQYHSSSSSSGRPQAERAEQHSSSFSMHSSYPKTEPSLPPSTTSNEMRETPPTEEEEELPTPVKGLDPFIIPSILSSTVIKRTPTEKVGLAFRKAAGTIVIEKIVPGSPFDGTALRPGYECLCINGHRLRSARRAAEIVRESGSSLTLMASNAPRPPGTMYTMISLRGDYADAGVDYAVGMHFKMKHGLVQLVKADADSPVGSSSMKLGDFFLAINGSIVGSISKAVEVLSESNEDVVPILYFNMRQLRVSLVDKVMGDLWKKEWSDAYDECVVLQPGSDSSDPLTLRFKEEGLCELLDPLRAFRDKSSDNEKPFVPTDHPLHSVVETLNHGIICVLAAIREGIQVATNPKGEGGSSSKGSSSDVVRSGEKKSENASSGGDVDIGRGGLIGELAKLSEMYKEGLLSKDDFEAIKSKLLKS